jgi:hypothetical protein
MQWNIDKVQDQRGQNWVRVQISGPTGQFVAFLEPPAAEQVGGFLINEGQQARTGLILPPGTINGHVQ